MSEALKGPYVAIVTPFDQQDSLNETELRNQVERQIRFGNNIFCNGTNGEFFVLSDVEKRRVTEICLEQADGRVQVVSHIGELTLQRTLAHGRDIQSSGVQAVSVITPWFCALRDQELIDYFTEIADSLEIPVYLYNIPARTGNTISPAVADQLAAHPNIYGIKDSAGSYESLSGFLEVSRKHHQFDVMTGPDSLILTGYQNGAVGCVSGIANIVPELVSQIYQGWKSHDLESANNAQEVINYLRSHLYPIAFAPAVVKQTLNLLGENVGDSRYPVHFSQTDIEQIQNIIKQRIS
ncbi:dihydrodipicolinate synthase family protein [Vibrio mangrovi]|uniref:4-hydroxy-tetrahydrodipicolinate synthase n=1 Tax=Vibrio mangrovi TaxID=474394 RepID=A0A1Y6ITT6_9VIBR|nr:dihydrodipicolinate synthase family protein [Vibrio mangrovi]MDW6004763.1 dihydrodipicolinate synthase family protein [Vibrio mangrovi]SMS01054.1 4-hydroxy-tetrahydrodipicolinate synthase [Vibrio mangrovi]